MASISFTCPHCNKVLRSNSRPAAGKKVKCPACGDPFVPELPDEEEATAIQEKASAKTRAIRRDADPDDAPRRKKPSRDHEDDEDEKPRAKKSRRTDDDEDEDEDDKPRSKKRDADDDDDDRSIKKKKKQKSGGMMWIAILLFLFGGGGLLGCLGCGVGVYFWKFNAKTDLALFVAPDANMVIGGNPKLMHMKMAKFEDLIRKQGMMGRQKNKLDDVSLNSERMIGFGNLKDPDRSLVTVFQSNTIDVLKVKNNPALGPAQTVAGHANVHIQNAGAIGNDLPRFLAFPGNEVIVTSEQSQDALIAALNRAKQPKQNNAALDLAKSVENSLFWMAIIPDAQALAEMRNGLEAGGGGGPMGQAMPPGLRNAAPAIGGVKGLTIALDVNAASDLKIRASVACKNADDAGKLKSACDDGFALMKTGLKEMEKFQPQGAQPLVPPSVVTDLNSIAFGTQGNDMTADFKFSSASIEELVKLGNNMQGGFPGPRPMANQDFAPGPPKGVPNDLAFKDLGKDPAKNGGKDFPKEIGPKAQGNVQIWVGNNLFAGKQHDKLLNFTQGKRVTVDLASLNAPKKTKVELVALRGNAGENIVTVERGAGDTIRFNVPANDVYRIRIRNIGANPAIGYNVRITEQ